ncbi:hypothetical protein [Parazoarcus communis]|nr:hypothetical protein [Parazoarcus communis]
MFAEAHGKLEARRRRDQLLIARAAQADQAGFKRVLAEIERVAR